MPSGSLQTDTGVGSTAGPLIVTWVWRPSERMLLCWQESEAERSLHRPFGGGSSSSISSSIGHLTAGMAAQTWMSQSCAARMPPILRRCSFTCCCACAARRCRSATRTRSAVIWCKKSSISDTMADHCYMSGHTAWMHAWGPPWQRCMQPSLAEIGVLQWNQHLLGAGVRLLAQRVDGGCS